MKTLSPLAWFANVACTLAVVAPVKAGNPFVADSKHGLLHLAESRCVPNYDKFEWLPVDGDQGDLPVDRVVVSLSEQRLYAYHHHQLLAWSNISSGRPGFETPSGDFVVSQKDPDHHSSLYENAPMPFFMRLTDAGLGLHAGFLPGYPASHGCVRLPLAMARELYQRVAPGTAVSITDGSVQVALAANKSVSSLSRL